MHPHIGVVGNNTFDVLLGFWIPGSREGVLEETVCLKNGRQAPALPTPCSEFYIWWQYPIVCLMVASVKSQIWVGWAHRHPLPALKVSCCDQCKGQPLLQTLGTEPLCLKFFFSQRILVPGICCCHYSLLTVWPALWDHRAACGLATNACRSFFCNKWLYEEGLSLTSESTAC